MTELYPVQTECLARARGKKGYIYGLEPGLGKTLAALVEFTKLRHLSVVDKMLVVCPNSLIGTWQEQIKLHGFNYTFDHPANLMADIGIINYEALLYRGGISARAFVRRNDTMLVIDEGIRVKNPAAKVTKFIVNSLTPYAVTIRVLNGTPMTESVEDLYSQLKVIDELVGVNRYAFRNKYAKKGGYLGKELIGCKDPAGLARLIEPFLFHAKKSEWAKGLPEKTFTVLPVKMTDAQTHMYRVIKQDFIANLVDGSTVTADAAIAIYSKLMQISMGFVINDDKQAWAIDQVNPKVNAVHDILAGFGKKQKAVIVAVNRYALDMIERALFQSGFTCALIRGGEDIEAAKKKFNETDCDVCLLGQQTGSVGLTLLGTAEKPCSTMIFVQNSWSSYLRTQTIERIHRYGQIYPCQYIDIVASPIDRAILYALAGKQSLVEAILDALKDND